MCRSDNAAIRYRTGSVVLILCNTIWYGTVLYRTVRYCTVRYDTLWYFLAAEDQMGSRRYFYLRCKRSSAKPTLLVLCGFRRGVAVALRLRGCGVVLLGLNCYRLNFHEILICMGTNTIAVSNLSGPDRELLLWQNQSGLYRFDENSIFASRDLAWSF